MNSQKLIKQFDDFLDALIEDKAYESLTDKDDILRELGEGSGYFEAEYPKIFDEINNYFGKVVVVDSVGGFEGDGEHTHYVLYFDRHDIYLKYIGWYESYEGSHFEDRPIEVRPVTKTVTVYE